MTEDINKTRLTLIQKIKDPDNTIAWEDFVSVYKGMIISWATYMGCNTAMADDVFQESIISLLRNLPDFEYNPSKGRFRGYLKTLVSRRVKDSFRRKKEIYENEFINEDKGQAAKFIDSVEDIHEPDESHLDLMWITSIVSHALKNARQKVDRLTYDSFRLYAVMELPVVDVCSRLGIDREGTVYQHKSRFIKLVSKELSDLLEDWGDINFSDSKLNLDGPELLKCITQIIRNLSPVLQTIFYQAEKIDVDSRLHFACKQIIGNPVPDSLVSKACIFNPQAPGNEWTALEADRCTIGRLQNATITLETKGVSSLHAIIHKKGSEWYLKDENSTNGTFINGERLSGGCLLKSGDIIHISESALIFTGA